MSLDRLGRGRPELGRLVQFHQELLGVLFAREFATPHWQSPGDAASVLASGVPLFRDRSPEFDEAELAERWQAVCAVIGKHRDREGPERLADAVATRSVQPADCLRTVLESGPKAIEAEFAGRGFDVQLGLSVLRLTSLPTMARLVTSLGLDWSWSGLSRGPCPACGSWPLLAEWRGLEQFRWLRCGLCSAGWRADRMFCPFCETRDHRQLHELFAEGDEQKHRVSACDGCGGFLRGISTLAALSPPALLVAEVETLHLDVVARQRGYAPAPGTE